MVDSIGFVLIGILLAVLVILAIREIACWYWKINNIVSLLEEINSRLDKILTKSDFSAYDNQNNTDNDKQEL